MDKGTFGSSSEYKTLEFLTEKIEIMDEKKKTYISRFISDINKLSSQLKYIRDDKVKNYIVKLIKDAYNKRTDDLLEKYDEKIVSYLKNYIKAKLKNIK